MSSDENNAPRKYDVVRKINELASNYKNRLSGGPGDIREYVAICDFHLRIIYTLAVAESHASQGGITKVISMPGFGTMLASVNKYASAEDVNQRGSWAVLLTGLARDFGEIVRQFKIPKRYANFKSMRDQLSHGYPIPADIDVVNQIKQALKLLDSQLERKIADALKETQLLVSEKSAKILLGSSKLDLLNLWDVSLGSSLGIYSNFAGNEIHYIIGNGNSHSRSVESCRDFTKHALAESKLSSNEINRFKKELLADISGFTEDYSPPNYYFGDDENIGVIFVPWTRSTSDDNVPRTDAFRVGPDNRREWQSTKLKTWVAYSDFLRDICSWPLLARRVKIGLEAFAKARNEEENSRLGGIQSNDIRGPARLKEVHDDLNEKSGKNAFELSPRVDQACEAAKPSTAVYFVVGQAGLGKTDLMLNLAITRAGTIEQDPEVRKPLYLFVSSTGKSLASLDEAVNSSLNITKLLSSQGARALCRNGLLVLFVDGFDELLGSSGYENALGSLEPWFQDLSGKGVLVASARSSYYLTQYRRSLASHKDLNVDHTLVEIQAWDKNDALIYLRERNVPSGVTSSLTVRDWELLSVPFFSKAFAAWFEAENQLGDTPKIFEIVTGQYLDREAQKLKDPIRGALLDRSEIKALFSEVAEMMQISQSREMEQSDLELCATVATSSDDLEKDRPGLSRRLTSICGIGVSTDSSGKNQFSFAHEVLFDCFLSSALQLKAAQESEVNSYIPILDKSGINDAVFEWFFENSQEAKVIIPKLIDNCKIDPKKHSILSKNLGALWTIMLTRDSGLPPTASVNGLQLGKIDLASEKWNSLEIKNCFIKELIIPERGDSKVKIINSELAYLCCQSPGQLRKSVSEVTTCNIISIMIGDEYGDDPARVRKILSECGIDCHDPGFLNTEMIDAATHYLRRIDRRPDVPVIISRDGRTVEKDDVKLMWAQSYGDAPWLSFIHALEITSLARLEPINSSGKPKVRLVINFPAASIIARDAVQEISDFWSLVARRI